VVTTVAAAALLLAPASVLEVADSATGRLLWRVRVRPGSRVDLHYINSLFNAPTTDRFVVEGKALRLVEINSTKEAVLLHAGLDGPFAASSGRFAAKRPGPRLDELTIRIGQTGQQRLAIDGEEVPLYRIGTGEAARVTVVCISRVRMLIQPPHAP
jgi:hypothetical protein